MFAMLRLTDRYAFDTRGYLLYTDVLAPKQVRLLREVIDAQRLEPGPTIAEQRFGAQGAMLGWHQALRDLMDHRVVQAVLPNPFDPSQYYLYRSGTIRTGLLTFTWALTDGRPGDGGFGCIPGSHRAEEPVPAGVETLVTEIAQPAGSLLVFTEALVHCTIPWMGADTRWALLYKYSPGSSAWDPAGWAAEILPSMTDRQRRLLEPPYVGGRRPALG
jgi:hypothetical protein